MKATKKIIPALVMLLVSAVLLSTASYAWFSMNTQVTATGMQVTVQAPASLLISTESDTGFGNTVALTSDTTVAETIFPTHFNTAYTFAKLKAEGMQLVNELGVLTGAAATEYSSFKDGNATHPYDGTYLESTLVDYFTDKIWLKYEGETGTANIKVKAEFENVQGYSVDDIRNAMHVVLVPLSGGTVVNLDMSNAGTAEALTALTSNEDATGYTVYYFLDGNDEDCKNTNILTDALINVKLTFLIDSVQPAPVQG